jgi:hypothetical protein
MESCVYTQKQWVDMTLVLVGILWIPLSTCCNICEADLQMNCSICRSLHPTGCSFHTLHAPNSAVLVFNFHSWTLFVVCVYHHLLCQHSQNHLLSGEMDRCVTGATKLPCLEGTPQMLANRSVTGEGLSKVTRVLQRLLAWERKLWLAICLANTYWTRGKINGMPYTDDCNQCSEMLFNFFNSCLGCMLDKFWLLFWKEQLPQRRTNPCKLSSQSGNTLNLMWFLLYPLVR